MKNKLLLTALFLLCLICICGFTWDSYRTPAEPVRYLYPTCESCGANRRYFSHIEGTERHAVLCAECDALIMEEDCSLLLEATCDRPGICLCDYALEEKLEHQLIIMPANEYTHDEMCIQPDCSCNINSPFYTGSVCSYAHTYTPFVYRDYRNVHTGLRHHSRVRTCTECGYEDYDTTPCQSPNQVACPGRAACIAAP